MTSKLTELATRISKGKPSRDIVRGFTALNGQAYILHCSPDVGRASLLCCSTAEVFILDNVITTTRAGATPTWTDFLQAVVQCQHIRTENQVMAVPMKDTTGTTEIPYTAYSMLVPAQRDATPANGIVQHVNRLQNYAFTLKWEDGISGTLAALDPYPAVLPLAAHGYSMHTMETVRHIFSMENVKQKLQETEIAKALLEDFKEEKKDLEKTFVDEKNGLNKTFADEKTELNKTFEDEKTALQAQIQTLQTEKKTLEDENTVLADKVNELETASTGTTTDLWQTIGKTVLPKHFHPPAQVEGTTNQPENTDPKAVWEWIAKNNALAFEKNLEVENHYESRRKLMLDFMPQFGELRDAWREELEKLRAHAPPYLEVWTRHVLHQFSVAINDIQCLRDEDGKFEKGKKYAFFQLLIAWKSYYLFHAKREGMPVPLATRYHIMGVMENDPKSKKTAALQKFRDGRPTTKDKMFVFNTYTFAELVSSAYEMLKDQQEDANVKQTPVWIRLDYAQAIYSSLNPEVVTQRNAIDTEDIVKRGFLIPDSVSEDTLSTLQSCFPTATQGLHVVESQSDLDLMAEMEMLLALDNAELAA